MGVSVSLIITQTDSEKRLAILAAFKEAENVNEKEVKKAFQEKYERLKKVNPNALYPGTAPSPTHVSLQMGASLISLVRCKSDKLANQLTSLLSNQEYETFTGLEYVGQEGNDISLSFLGGHESYDFLYQIIPILSNAGLGEVQAKIYGDDWDEGIHLCYEDGELYEEGYDPWAEED